VSAVDCWFVCSSRVQSAGVRGCPGIACGLLKHWQRPAAQSDLSLQRFRTALEKVWEAVAGQAVEWVACMSLSAGYAAFTMCSAR